MSELEQRLAQLRIDIDRIDKRIIKALNERADVALAIAKLKQAMDEDPVYYRPDREAVLLRNIVNTYQGHLDAKDVAEIYRHIMAACLKLQQPQTIAFLGPLGTFSHLGALKHFGQSITALPVESIEAVFKAVDSGQAHYGVVPIENSTEGMVNTTLDILLHSSVQVCGEINLPIHHHLLCSKTDAPTITRIYAHEQSFAQCQQWLQQHYPQAEQVVVRSNAVGAKRAMQEPGVAAIAGEMAAELYQLEKIATCIEDSVHNTTRFLLLGQHAVPPSGHDKTSLLIPTGHTPGSMITLMQPFAQHHVNITSIASRPYSHQNWHYVFFVDIVGHQEDKHVQRALKALAKEETQVTILGSYPVAVL